MDIVYDIKIGEFVATAMTGEEVYGATAAECEERLREANRVWIEYCRKSPVLTDHDSGAWAANARRLQDEL